MNQNQIQQKLTTLGKSQSWLASQTGLANTYINNLICNRVPNPTIKTVFRLAKALGCRAEDLYSMNGQPEKEENWI